MRLKSDLLAALLATADGVLDTFDLRWHDEAALTVVHGRQAAIRATTPRAPRSAASRLRAQSRAWRSSMPARAATATGSSPTAGGCSTSRRAARRSPRRSSAPTRRSRNRLAGRILSHRHRLAGDGAGEERAMNAHRRPLSRFRRASHQRRTAPRSSCAPAAPGRRCCCCTATRRPMSCGTRSRPSLRATARWCSPTCAATAPAPRRRATPST